MEWNYLDLTTTDPHWNLALEQYVFDRLPRDRSYFLLWQNDRSVIIGKHQNTLAEIDLPYVEAQGIQVVRRLSGGGAVYHDLGNLNFTFITDGEGAGALDFALFCRPVVRVLESFGVSAQISGRNDITVCGKKFSGNSQYTREGRVMHHGTILFDSDLDAVTRALRVDEEKIRSKGVPSVRSRVTNLKEHLPPEVDLPRFRRALLEQVMFTGLRGRAYTLTPEDRREIDRLKRERYDTWDWNFGQSPSCALVRRARVEGCGLVELFLQVERGRLTGVAFRGDFFSAEEPEELERLLTGCPLELEACRRALEGVDLSRYFHGLDRERFLQLLCQGR